MKNLVIVVLMLVFSSVAVGEVSTRVCLADANTPLELADPNVPFVYRDIMVGTKLTIIVDSNIAGSWSGGLFIPGSDREYGVLSGRDFNDVTLDWEGSHFDAAGDKAWVLDVNNMIMSGFDLHTNNTADIGEWFILDYKATNIRICTVDFYDYGFNWDIPLNSLEFSHVRTRDFNQDTKVDFTDFGLLALYWLRTDCNVPDRCSVTDLNDDGIVDHDDLMLFTEYWLDKTE
ncbi:MAG: hypothetical protein JXA81_04650 [Sedimentisphaerales bacterium]|nr:hypothetical protein [Sedimentisphaerales bacterium]